MKDKINGRTPEEIKKGLEHCSEDGCKGCNYKESCDMADGFSVLAYDALAYIQQLESALPKWISVEERLPEEGVEVLVYFDGVIAKSEIVMFDVITKDPMWSYTGDGGDPSHWMPLPEPPEVNHE